MPRRLRLLLVEDSEADAELVLEELRREGYDVAATRVQTAAAMREELQRQAWDLVISDYSLPSFSAPGALKILQETPSRRGTPFIIVSGTVGEATAVAALQAGASDFLPKGNLARFLPAVERELREARLRRERQLIEEQLRQSQKLEAIGRLAGGVAHDFNNILTAILGYSEMVLEQIGPDKPISADLQEICKASQRGAALTRQLLAFSRKQALDTTVLDVNAIVTDMREMLKRLVRDDIELSLHLEKSTPPVVGDRTQLEQVIMNLVSNAGDAMPEGGTVTIQTRRLEGDPGSSRVRLSVTDTGSGMDDETQRQIFEPFFTTKAIGHGTGLGLSTVYGVVQQLGGTISVSSKLGSGTAFTIEFAPVSDGVTVARRAVESMPCEVAMNREVILVVDDEESLRHLASRVLARHGYRVIEASNGAEALHIVSTHDGHINLVLSDLIMPGMHGTEMVDQLLKRRADLRVLYMSGYADQAIPNHQVSRATLLDKPFTSSELLRRVRESLTAPLPAAV